MQLKAAHDWRLLKSRRLIAGAAFCLSLIAPSLGFAEAEQPVDTVGSISRVLILEGERKRNAEELAGISNSIQLSQDSVKSLDAEIAALAEDRGRIRDAMIAAAAQQQSIEKDIAATEQRIDALAGDEANLKASLRERRGLLAEVLGALERMGRKPPPALLVKPDDALGSERSAILLGAVVPGIRKETEKLAGDLKQLAAVKRDIATEKQRFVDGRTKQKQEEARLARLFEEKQRLEADNRSRREAERAHAAELAAKATSLQDLIASLETESESARAAEAAAEKVAEAKRRADAEAARIAEAKRQEAIRQAALRPTAPDERNGASATPPAPPAVADLTPSSVPEPEKSYDVASLRRDMAQLGPVAAFSTMKGRLTAPVSGALQVGYGVSDGIGKPSSGVSFAARAGDLVTAPADGRVLYSGPFLSYGQLLILDAGDGYHVVLAGMNEIDVEVGQFVLSGEPVAVMGARRLASAAGAEFGAAEPALYVEFRKNGKPVDPTPWWTVGPSGRTRNDS